MAHKQYSDIAAARHMKSSSPQPKKGSSDGKRADASGRPLKPRRALMSENDKAYRKKRMVALLVTTLVCLSVPALIILLVLFG
ncbi:hypothetical protein [Arthrobacter sp.]|uniref:hypothetical protein n=1 Tax=Arthrobacter sp. TaxID=1667 RepID=UPI0028A1EA8D|nr:hypothetical protein [Arthrobacter sp.]